MGMPEFETSAATSSRPGITPARIAAAAVLRDLRGGRLLDGAFEDAGATLDARDRRWVRELVYATLRRRAWIDAVLEARVRGGIGRLHPDVHDLARLGVTQLLHMSSVPAYAAIAQTVEQAKVHGVGASKLVNAVLRRVDRERDGLEPALPADPIDALALATSHPRWLVARWVARWGMATAKALLDANNLEAHTILRPVGLVREQIEAMLEADGVQTFEPPLTPDGIAIQHGMRLTSLTAFRQGHCFVQDPAATMVARYAAFAPDALVADVCAAPGGKAFELAASVRAVVACDASHDRVARIAESVARMEFRNVFPCVAEARRPCVAPMGAVLLDAPCTGTGTFRRHPDARWRLKPSDLAVMGAVQRALLSSAAAIVAPGGVLVYSTCSLEQEENDDQVDAFLSSHPEFALEPPPAGAVPPAVLDAGRLRVLPHVHGTDGSFAARMRRRPA